MSRATNVGIISACDAGEIVVAANTRIAELEAEEREARPKPKEGAAAHATRLPGKRVTETQQKQRKQEANRAPLLRLSEKDRETYFRASRGWR